MINGCVKDSTPQATTTQYYYSKQNNIQHTAEKTKTLGILHANALAGGKQTIDERRSIDTQYEIQKKITGTEKCR